ncbi:ABC transporter substrate-binding protein [Bradyrhizobium liaoningense]|nr:ABC transporter substrate-binding protein [Bradyrhizobium liaoningense]
MLSAAPIEIGSRLFAAFERGLRDLGWHQGRDLMVEYRSADGHFDRLPRLASELANFPVELILAVSGPETKAAMTAAKGIPVAFAVHGDPVGVGDVQSLAHPGGLATGSSQMHPELSRKQLELFKEYVPALSRVAVLWNSANPLKANDWVELKPAAQALALRLDPHEIEAPADLDATLTRIDAQRPDGLLVLGDPRTVGLRAVIVNFASGARLPAMYPFRLFVDVGGLMSYGADLTDLFRRAASYVDRILKGARPQDLPVEQPIKFELVINLKTARMLDLSFSPTLLARADEVIE